MYNKNKFHLNANLYWLNKNIISRKFFLHRFINHRHTSFPWYFSSILLNSTANSKVSLHISLCEIHCKKNQTMNLVLYLIYQRFFVFYLLSRDLSPATEKSSSYLNFFFSHANEVKTCGLEQQLILRMLRNLILQ